jgi:hypothetical protein
MGLFKDMKNLNELGKHHGGMPSLRGAFQDIGAMADDRGEREVLETGTPARAIAKGFAEAVPGDRFAMHIPLEVHPPGGSPYMVYYVFPTTRMKAAMTVGMEIPVKIHPQDPSRIAVQWDAQQASIAAAGGDQAAVMAGMQANYGAVADQAFRQQQAQQATEDPAEKLKKLAQMRDAGLITAAEHDAKKAEILREF